jgi:hypothetical protein
VTKLSSLQAALERHRDVNFRRIPSRRVSGEKSALAFINATGFCTAFTAGLGVPSLREAIAGRREPALPHHIQHDPAIIMTWEIKDALPARRLAYYGKVIAGRPSFVAREMLPAFLRLRAKPGGYPALYERGELSRCAKLVMDALVKRSPVETRALRLASGCGQSSRRAEFDRAMKELQEKFLALKVEERYDPFCYIWDTVERRWAVALGKGLTLGEEEAAYQIVRRYFEVAAYGDESELAKLLRIEHRLIDRAARQLEAERRLVRGIQIGYRRRPVSLLADLAG